MYVHKERRIGYMAHMKVGSQGVRDVLMARGFTQIYGHHGGPWVGRQHKFNDAGQDWWWRNGSSRHWRFACTVRNHFDILRTYWYWTQKGLGAFPQEVDVLASFVERFMWQRVPHFHTSGRLYRFVQEVPGVEVWHFEDQRERLNHWLWSYGLEELGGDEYVTGQPKAGHFTPEKPTQDWTQDYTPTTRQWVEARFGQEMAELGYCYTGQAPWA